MEGWLISNSAFATIFLVENGTGTSTWRAAGAGEVNVVLSGTLNAWYTTATIAVGDQVWIKNGTYVLTGSITPKGGESIYGGFAGTETAISQRAKGTNAWDFTNETVLDGNKDISNTTGTNVIAPATSNLNPTMIGGLTITKGINLAIWNMGAGATLENNTIMQNCKVFNCYLGSAGIGTSSAGVHVRGFAKLLNSYIYNNVSAGSTGGVAVLPDGIIDGCKIDGNTAAINGGGVYINSGTGGGAKVLNSTITNNSVTASGTSSNGGGINVWQNSTLTSNIEITNCTISNNSSSNVAGGFGMNQSASPYNLVVLTNVTMNANTATSSGGAISISKGDTRLNNCTLTNNVSGNVGGAINVSANTTEFTINNTLIKGNSVPDGNNASAINAAFPIVCNNVVITGNKGKNHMSIVFTTTTGASFNNCTFASNTLNDGTTFVTMTQKTSGSNIYTNCLFYNCNTNPLFYQTTNGGVAPSIKNCGFDATGAGKVSTYTDLGGNITTLASTDFKDAANADFRLVSGSAAKDAGTTIAATSSDILGVTRPKGPKYDMGAYEYCNEWVGSGNWSNTANWSAGALPTSTDGVLVKSGSIIIDQVATINDISINPTATLTNNSTLNTTYLNLKSDATGTGTYVDNGTTNIAGSVKVQQYLTGAGSTTPNNRFWYISSPVSAATSAVLDAAGANKLWSYSEPAHAYTEIVDNATTLAVTKGYAARLGANITAEFTGSALNNGDYTVSLTRAEDTNDKRGYNLVGNPYPSFLDWELVTKSSAVLPTIWTRSFNGSAMGFDTYNGALHSGVSANGNSVSKYIAPMQAFWVKVDAGNTTGTISLANTMRSVVDQTHSTNKLKAPAISNQKIIRLQVSNGKNSDETLIAFNENASNAFDQYDSPKMSNSNVAIPELFTSVGGEQLAINGRNSFVNNEELPLGFTAGEANNYSITASQIDNFDSNTSILLKDNLLDTELELNNGTVYNFNSDATVASTRFSVFFKSKSITTDLINTTNIKFNVFKSANNEITVQHNMNGSEGVIDVFNFVGQKIMNMPCSGDVTKITHSFNPGVYLLSVTVAGQAQTQKIIIN